MSRVEYSQDDLPPRRFIGLIKHLIVPRPIAWVSTISADGIENLAPHSFFTVASEAPAIVQFTSIGHKDSLRNVRETGEFVISLASEPLFDQVNDSSADFPPDIDEFEFLGIEREPAAMVRPSRVAASPATLECRLLDTIPVADGRCVIVLGEVLYVAISEAALTDGRPDIHKLAPLAKLGGDKWGLLGEIREKPRPRYEDLT